MKAKERKSPTREELTAQRDKECARRGYLSVAAAAEKLKRTINTIYEWIRRGEIEVMYEGKFVYVRSADLEKFRLTPRRARRPATA